MRYVLSIFDCTTSYGSKWTSQIQVEQCFLKAHSQRAYTTSRRMLRTCAGGIFGRQQNVNLWRASTIYADEIYLVTGVASSGDNIWDRLYTPFKPFESRAWAWVLFALVYTAAGSHFCEVRHTRNTEMVRQKTT